MAEKNIEVGDKVQWNYGAGHPQGVAAEVKTHPGEKVQIESQKGNTVTRNADQENPAVRVERQGDGNNQDVVKRMSELTKVGEGKGEEGEGEGEAGENGPGVGEKRERETMEEQDKATERAEKVAGERASETEVERAVEEANDKEPEAKKAKLGEQGEGTAKAKEAGAKSTRGRGRNRGKASTTTTAGTRRAGGGTKKGSIGSQEKPVSASVPAGGTEKVEGARGKVDEAIMSEVIPEAEGEEEQGAKVKAGEAPSGHTRSQDVQTSAHN